MVALLRGGKVDAAHWLAQRIRCKKPTVVSAADLHEGNRKLRRPAAFHCDLPAALASNAKSKLIWNAQDAGNFQEGAGLRQVHDETFLWWSAPMLDRGFDLDTLAVGSAPVGCTLTE